MNQINAVKQKFVCPLLVYLLTLLGLFDSHPTWALDSNTHISMTIKKAEIDDLASFRQGLWTRSPGCRQCDPARPGQKPSRAVHPGRLTFDPSIRS